MNEQKEKFTPGPWAFDGREMVCSVFGNIGQVISAINPKTGKPWEKDLKGKIFYPYKESVELLGDKEENRKANGYLIAAAPEMYEFGEEMEKALTMMLDSDTELSKLTRMMLTGLRNQWISIAKQARGE